MPSNDGNRDGTEKGKTEEQTPLVKRLAESTGAAYGHFAETTTFGGVVHTYLSPHWVWKAIWVVIVLGLLAATIWNTTLVVQDFLSYPVTTKVSVSYEPSVPFPTVTVCNRNPIQCLKLAHAYVKHPEELNGLFYFSKCADSVIDPPLIYRLLLKKTNDEEIVKWQEETYARILDPIQTERFELIDVKIDPIACVDAFNQAGGVPNLSKRKILEVLLGKCNASTMSQVLFPRLHEPPKQDEDIRTGPGNDETEGTEDTAQDSPADGLSTTEVPADAEYVDPNQQAKATTDGTTGKGTDVLARQVAANPVGPEQKSATTEEPTGDETTEEPIWFVLNETLATYLPTFDFGSAPEDIYNSEKFILEFTEIAKDMNKIHLLRDLLDSFDEFIVNCTYFGQSCLDQKEFVLNYVPSYGSCYSFNSAYGQYDGENTISGNRKAYLTGSTYGLSLEVLLDQDNYLPSSAAAGAGARITISPPGLRPNPADEGYYVKPHSEADISLRLLKVKRLPEPFASECWSDWSNTNFKPLMYNPADNTTFELEVYSYSECRQICSSYLLAQYCLCVDAHNPDQFMYDGEEVTGRLKVCDMTNNDDAQCRRAVLGNMETDSENFGCPCNLPCEDNQYIATSSTSEWPSDMYMPSVLRRYSSIFEEINHHADTSAWTENGRGIVARELAKINIYMETLNIQEIEEEAKYDFFQLLSDLGGALGLYLGFCGITLFEIVEFLILMGLSFFGFNASKVGSEDEENEDGETRTSQSRMGSAFFPGNQKSAQLSRFFGVHGPDLRSSAVFKDPPGVFVPKSSAKTRVAFADN